MESCDIFHTSTSQVSHNSEVLKTYMHHQKTCSSTHATDHSKTLVTNQIGLIHIPISFVCNRKKKRYKISEEINENIRKEKLKMQNFCSNISKIFFLLLSRLTSYIEQFDLQKKIVQYRF